MTFCQHNFYGIILSLSIYIYMNDNGVDSSQHDWKRGDKMGILYNNSETLMDHKLKFEIFFKKLRQLRIGEVW